jgi:prevent-host-death family protein
MSVVTIEDAKTRLGELIEHLRPGEEIIITRDKEPVARLIAESKATEKAVRKLGTLQGTVLYMAPDFDAPLNDFKEYME